MAVIRLGMRGIAGVSMRGIAGALFPSSPKLSLTKGGTVFMAIRVQNTGGLSIAPYYWLRVHHSSTFGTGALIVERLGQMSALAPGAIATISASFMDNNPIGWRDVFLKLAPSTFAGGLNPTSYPGGEDHWASAYEVVGTAGVAILDLTLS